MKKLITLALILITVQIYADKPISKKMYEQGTRYWESTKLSIDFMSDELTENQYISKLKNCSDDGNRYCTASLGQYYLVNKNQYAQAYPLLLQASKDIYTPDPSIGPPAAIAYYNLGQMYQNGAGILQNNDKAIECFTKSATYGADRNSAMKVALILTAKWRLESKHYEANEYLTKSYAWWKIAQTLPESGIPIKKIDGKVLDPSEMISIFEKFDEFKSYIKEGDKLAQQICSSIPTCIQ